MVRGMDSLVSRGLVGVLVAGVDNGELACDIWCVCMRACILVRCGFGLNSFGADAKDVLFHTISRAYMCTGAGY